MSGGLTRGLIWVSEETSAFRIFTDPYEYLLGQTIGIICFLGTVPYFGTKTCGPNFSLEKTSSEVLVMWIVLSPQSILLLLKTNIPTNWDEEQNKNTYQVITGSKLGALWYPTLKNQFLSTWWSAESSWSTVSMFHMSIVKKKHTVMSCVKNPFGREHFMLRAFISHRNMNLWLRYAEVIFTTYIQDGAP